MALVSGTIKNLLGGVSQAPPEQRDASQFTEQLNMLPRAGLKLQRRPPLKHLSKLTSTNLSGAFTHQLGDYTIVITNAGAVSMYHTATGVAQTVTNNVTWGYLTNSGTLKAISSGDSAYIVNTAVVAQQGPGLAPPAPFYAHVTVLAGDYETTYSITLNGTTFSTTTPAAGGAGAKAATTTTAIAAALSTLIVAGGNFTVGQYGSVLSIKRTTSVDFSISTADGLSDQGLGLAKTSVRESADLPKYAELDTVLEVTGDNNTRIDNYFVKSVASSGFLAGVGDSWVECTRPSQKFVLDGGTLPVRVIPVVGGFSVEACVWTERAAGDDITNPFPSFLGSKINDLFIFDGRLGLLSGNKVFLSVAGNYFNWFRTSAIQILDTDPIDVSGTLSGAVRFDWAVNWNEAIYIFANGRSQYRLSAENGALSASTISIVQQTEYRYDLSIRPLVVGSRLFFVSTESGYPHVVDYHARGTGRLLEGVSTGLHVPTYVTGTARLLIADDARGILLLQTSTGLFVYNYQYSQDDRVQGAWSKWTFGSGTVLSITSNSGVLLFVMAYADGTYLNEMRLDRTLSQINTDGTILFPPGTVGDDRYIDRSVWTIDGTTTAVWDGTFTTWTLPYSVALDGSEGEVVLCLWDARTMIPVTRTSPTTARVNSNQTGAPAGLGVRYVSSITPSTLYVRDRDGAPDTRGRLQVRNLRVQYNGAHKIDVLVTNAGRAPKTTPFTSVIPTSGEMVVPILSRNVDTSIVISMDSAGADSITGLSWEGEYHTRAARL